MRGVATGAMVTALTELGFKDAFTDVYGASSGLAAALYFVSGQAELGTSIYYENLTDEKFLSYKRWPFMNISFLVDEVMREVKPLDLDAVRASKTRVYTILYTHNCGFTMVWVNNPKYSDDEILNILKASMSLPLFATYKGVEVFGERAFDSGWYNNLPLLQANLKKPEASLCLLTSHNFLDASLDRLKPRDYWAFRLLYGSFIAKLLKEEMNYRGAVVNYIKNNPHQVSHIAPDKNMLSFLARTLQDPELLRVAATQMKEITKKALS